MWLCNTYAMRSVWVFKFGDLDKLGFRYFARDIWREKIGMESHGADVDVM